MDRPRFRVVLTGELGDGFSRDAVMSALARYFEVPARDLLGLFDGSEYLVDAELSVDDAVTLQRQVEAMGTHARVEPVSSNAAGVRTLLQLPRQADPADAGLMHCPACGHKQLVAERCDECGVVFAEYNRSHPHAAAAPRPSSARRPAVPPAAPRRRSPQEARADWRHQWVESAEDELPTEEYHLHLFMGRHAGHLAGPCRRMAMGQRTIIRPSWAWGALISPFLWAMFRKMWFWGMVIFVLEVLLPVVLITLGAQDGISDKLTWLGIGLLVANRLFWPIFLKGLYCRHARSTIAYLHRMSPTFAPDIDIAAAGGTSRTSVFVGIVLAIVVSLLTWNIVDTFAEFWSRSTPVAIPVPEASPLAPVPAAQPAAPTVDPQVELLANENKWVATRSHLRTLGQRINTWLLDTGNAVDPAILDVDTIAAALRLDADATLDGWGNKVRYASDGVGYRLVSPGPDGEFGTSDDVEYRRTLQR